MTGGKSRRNRETRAGRIRMDFVGRYRLRSEEHTSDRQYQAEETCEVVPAQGVRLHENQREQREDRERDHLLDDF